MPRMHLNARHGIGLNCRRVTGGRAKRAATMCILGTTAQRKHVVTTAVINVESGHDAMGESTDMRCKKRSALRGGVAHSGESWRRAPGRAPAS
eukprot:5169420-Prymnesium_polylepis.3